MRGVISLSGGMDSTTLLAHLRDQGHEMLALMFTYGSKHNLYEENAAFDVASYYGVPIQIVDLTKTFAPFRSDLLLSGGDIPEGHYEDSNMQRTVVPGRNLIFTAVAAGYAESIGAQFVALGIHSGDHAIYPDCRPEFYKSARETVRNSSDGKVGLLAPFLNMHKGQIVTMGCRLNVPYHVTRTCYKNQEIACGRCGSCQERLEAFRFVGAPDPIQYEFLGVIPKSK